MATETIKKKETKKETKKVVKKPAKSTKKVKAPKKESKKDSLFAVIKTGGKQYLVQEGDVLKIEVLKDIKEDASKISFDEVLLVENDGKTKIGTPTVSGSKVAAELVEVSRDKKISVIRYRSKSRYFKKNGHRQPKMTVRITGIK